MRGVAFRFLARFFAIYLVLYVLPFPLDSLPLHLVSEKAAEWMSSHVSVPYRAWMDTEVKSLGARLFGLTITIGPMGSGDTTWNYVQLVGFGFVAFGATLIWSTLAALIRPLWRAEPRLHDWWRVLIRFNLAATMIGYGAIKVIKSQMSEPTIDRLVQSFGDHSPMGLLWDFVGFSQAYCIFSGAGEMLAGVLLTARRTTTAGALVTIGVMTHVTMLNFCFDTPVKLFSTHLLVMGVLLVAPDARRLFDFLVLQRPVIPAPVGALLPWRWPNWVLVLGRTAFFGYMIWMALRGSWENRNQYGDLAPKPPLYGAWDVEIFEVDGELVSEDSDAVKWERLLIGRYRMGVDRSDGSRTLYFARATPKSDRLDLSKPDDPSWARSFKCELTTPDSLLLDGRFDGHDLHLELTRAPDPFLLTNRGFHWINETPFNR